MKKNHLLLPGIFTNGSILLAAFNIFWLHIPGLTIVSLVIPAIIVIIYVFSDIFIKAEMEKLGADRHPLKVVVYLNVIDQYETTYQVEGEELISFFPSQDLAQIHVGYTIYPDHKNGIFLVQEHCELTWSAYRKLKK